MAEVERGVTHKSLPNSSKLIILNLVHWKLLYLFIFLITIPAMSDGLPLLKKGGYSSSQNRHHRQKRLDFGDKQLRYLMDYGYLPMSGIETGNLRTEKEVREAIIRLQRFGNINETGRIDAETRALMQRPRCALPDIMPDDYPSTSASQNQLQGHSRTKRFVKQGSKWEKLNLTWGIRSYPPEMSQGDVRRDLMEAMDLWGSVSRLNFIERYHHPDEADIIIEFKRGYHGDGYPFDGEGKTVAHAFYPDSEKNGDVHFDDDEKWLPHRESIDSYEGISLKVAAAHELGHSLGLYHSNVKGALMSPFLLSFPEVFALPQDDQLGIQSIYGAPEERSPTVWDYSSTTTTTTTTRPPRRTSRPHPEPTTRPPRRPSRPGHETTQPSRPVETTPRPRDVTPGTEKPNFCDTDYDAISVIRTEIHIFKGKYFWRVSKKGKPLFDSPVEIIHFWQGLPKNLTHIDAVYERPSDRKIVFFIDSRYYILHGNERLEQTGPLHSIGLPKDLPKIDGAFVWGHNGKTYFFAETMYWRFDETIQRVEWDYPRDMLMWRGVPYHIDSAFTYKGVTHFFKGRRFYEFDDLRMKVTKRSPLLSATFWLNCPDTTENPNNANAQIKSVTSRGHVISERLFPAQLIVAMATILFPSLLFSVGLGIFQRGLTSPLTSHFPL